MRMIGEVRGREWIAKAVALVYPRIQGNLLAASASRASGSPPAARVAAASRRTRARRVRRARGGPWA
eukprot:6492673-Pyramimonas_sp.AAC.1